MMRGNIGLGDSTAPNCIVVHKSLNTSGPQISNLEKRERELD